MKKFLFIYVVAAVLAFAFGVRAQDMGVSVGLRSNSADSDIRGLKVNSKTTWTVGGVGFFELSGPMFLRSGFFYTNRSFAIDTGTSSTTGDVNLAYFDIPVGVMYKMGDYGGPFVGAVLALNAGKSCPGGSCEGVKSTPAGFQVGGSFKFAPQMGAALYYEAINGNLMDGIKDSKAVEADFIFFFD